MNLRTWATDRVDLAKSKGEFIEQTCQSCETKDKYHVDSFSAQPNRIAQIIGLAVFIIGTPLILIFIWQPLLTLTWSYAILAIAALLLIPVTIYGIIQKEDRRKVSSFNRHKFKGH